MQIRDYRKEGNEISIVLDSIDRSGLFFKEIYYTFLIYRNIDEQIVGYIDFRLGPEKIMYFAGNVGYQIKPSFRGHHYAYQALCLLVLFLKDFDLATSFWISCSPENVASLTTIEKFQAHFLEEVDVPKSHWLYKRGEKRKRIYQVDLV